MKNVLGRPRRLCRPIYFLTVFILFFSFNSSGDQNPSLSASYADSWQLDAIPEGQLEAENPVASGFVFFDLPLPAWARGFRQPVAGAKVPNNEDQLPGAARRYRNGRHEGVDIYCAYGTPIRAAKDGYVLAVSADYHELSKAFRDRLLGIAHKLVSTPAEVTDILHGRRVIMDHGYTNGRWVITIYSHLSEVEQDLKPGTFIKQGRVIGYSGNSGTSQAGTKNQTHLHFEIRVNDHYLGEGMSQKEAGRLYSAVMGGKQE
ncbi:MAG: M23 family metallopeptidase [Candidatus Paceibacterota bacterium]|jgi:murein DD-endopeptidase MepM/ murein hydrolase activator NlpD